MKLLITGLQHHTNTKADGQLASFRKRGCPNKHHLLPWATQRWNRLEAVAQIICLPFLCPLPALFICPPWDGTLFFTGGSIFTAIQRTLPILLGCDVTKVAYIPPSASRTAVRISRSFERWPVQRHFVWSTPSHFSICWERLSPPAKEYETQSRICDSGRHLFLISIFSHDRLNFLVYDSSHLYNYAYLTYCKFEIEGCLGVYCEGWCW